MEVSWAATREPAARMATCENFMVDIVIGDVTGELKVVVVVCVCNQRYW